jgi:hypothetical protein
MKDSRFSQLLEEVIEKREKGETSISLELLESALRKLNEENTTDTEWDKLITTLKHQSELEGYKAAQEESRRLFEAVINFAGIALKSAILINGGAAVAMLAYLGHVGRDDVASEFPLALLLYVGGVLSAAVATAASYLAQYQYNFRNHSGGNLFRGAAITLVILSYGAFGLGGYSAYLGFID